MDFRLIVDQVRDAAADGLTLREAGQILGTLCRELVAAAEQLNAGGATKKDVVMGWVRQAIGVLVPAMPLPLWLRPFAPIVRSVATTLLIDLADGLVESAVDALDS